MQNWLVDTVLDPEALRRLRLLYQYGAGHIPAIDLLCQYPIPQRPDNAASHNSAGQKGKSTIYIRAFPCQHQPTGEPVWVTVGLNPDFAFLNSPGCVLCAFPNARFRNSIKPGTRIYDNVIGDHSTPYDPQKNDYVEVVVNDYLLPNAGSFDTPRGYEEKYWQLVDWLSVVGGGEFAPDNAKAVGSANGYTVYVYPDRIQPGTRPVPARVQVPPLPDQDDFVQSGDFHFSEFVLAVIEASLQSPEFAKVTQPTPAVTQSIR